NLNVKNAATVGDILNSGWNVQENGAARDFVKAYDTVNFVNGSGTIANVSVNANGTIANVSYNADVDGTTVIVNKDGKLQAISAAPIMGNTDAENGKATVGTSPEYTDEKGDILTKRPDGTFVKVDGTVVDAANVTTTNKSDAPRVANVGDIVETINKTGFNMSANNANSTLVNPGETVNFVNGNGTSVSLSTDANGTSTIKVDSPIAYVNANKDDTSTPSNTSTFVGAEPVQVQNVASGVRAESKVPAANVSNPTAGDKKAIANAIGNVTGATLTNVANIGDVQAAAAAAKTEVTSANGTIAVSNSTGANGQTIYNVEVANTTLTVSNGTGSTPAGKVEA
ncbi:hypothetical protein SAMN02746062_02365, partial [Alysiella filiformis DSM 16848]